MNTTENPLGPLVSLWLKKVKLAWDVKRAEFGDDADEAMQFFDGPYSFLYGLQSARGSRSFFYTGGDEHNLPKPTFAMTVNKVAEMVQLFGPVLYHRNPNRKVGPRKPPMIDPALFNNLADPVSAQMYAALKMRVDQERGVDQARSGLLESYLNFTPVALDLKTHSRRAIDEAVIKGMGTLWTELYVPRGAGHRLVGSFYDSVDNLCVDCDMESLDDAKWVARRCVQPVWQVEREFGLEPGMIRGTLESHESQAQIDSSMDGTYRRAKGLTNDLCIYWRIYSKMGMGGRMSGVTGELRDQLEGFGDFSYIVVAENCDYLLNLPPSLTQSGDVEAMKRAVEWPTPFWADDAWPFTPICFHERPRKVWPMSHLKPGMGELKFINWVYSFVASKIKVACRDFIAMRKGLNEEIKSTILHGTDYELIEIDHTYGTITEAVQFLQHPPFNGDIFKVLEAVEANFEKRVGLTELMYGMSARQFRSAEEANVKNDALQVRPDDMANKVEDAMGDVARKEALAARWHLNGADVKPVMGDVAAYYWDQLVTAADPAEILHQLEYRIEAGSVKKPNKARDAGNMQQAMQNLFQPLWSYAQATGNAAPVNALIVDWAKSIDLDPTKYLLSVPPPMGAAPPAPPSVPGGPPAGAPPAGPPAK